MGNMRRVFALRIGVVLVLLASALFVPAAGSAGPIPPCYYPTPPARTDTGSYYGLKITVSYTYATCVATVTVENRNEGYVDQFSMSLWARAGVCDEYAPNGTKLAQWDGKLTPYGTSGYKHTISAPSAPNRCFRGYFIFGPPFQFGSIGGEDVYAPNP